MVILALVLSALGTGSGSGNQTGPLPVVTAPAPPHAAAHTAACTALLDALPIQLEGLAPRVVHTNPPTPFVVAWGDPAIVVSCGVGLPAGFGPGSSAELISGGTPSGAFYYVSAKGDSQIYTAVDRTAVVSFAIPGAYPGANYLPVLNKALLQAMPTPACSTNSATEPDPDKLCTRRRA